MAAPLFLCAAASCDVGPALRVVVAGLPVGAAALEVQVDLGEGGAQELPRFTSLPAAGGEVSFGLRLPGGYQGEVRVAARSLSATGCMTALGDLRATVSERLMELRLPLDAAAAGACAAEPTCQSGGLAVTRLTPDALPRQTGGEVLLQGWGFRRDASVAFYRGTQKYPAAVLEWRSARELRVQVPALPETFGKLELAVENPGRCAGRWPERLWAHTDLSSFDGAFPPGQGLRVALPAARLHGVVAAQLDGQGPLDLVTVDRDSNEIAVVLAQTTMDREGVAVPVYGAATRVKVGETPIAVAAADLDGDGALDLVVSSFDEFNRQGGVSYATVLMNNGRGAFGERRDLPVPRGAWGLALGDLNGDGLPDILVTKEERSSEGTVALLLQQPRVANPRVAFAAPLTLKTGCYRPRGVAIGDVDGDALPDVFTSCYGLRSGAGVPTPGTAGLSVHRNLGMGTFADPILKSGVLTAGWSVAVGSVTRGRLQAAVVADESKDGPILFLPSLGMPLLGGAGALFPEGRPLVLGSGTDATTVALGDLDGDGWPDLVVGAGTGDLDHPVQVSVLRNLRDAARPFNSDSEQNPARLDWVLAAKGKPWSLFQVLVADLNQDQRPDLVVSIADGSKVDGGLRVRLNAGR